MRRESLYSVQTMLVIFWANQNKISFETSGGLCWDLFTCNALNPFWETMLDTARRGFCFFCSKTSGHPSPDQTALEIALMLIAAFPLSYFGTLVAHQNTDAFETRGFHFLFIKKAETTPSGSLIPFFSMHRKASKQRHTCFPLAWQCLSRTCHPTGQSAGLVFYVLLSIGGASIYSAFHKKTCK
jgi:hypothetical protein